MLTITRITIARYTGYNARIPCTDFYTSHQFDYAIGSTYPHLQAALEALHPVLIHLDDFERVWVRYTIDGCTDETCLWPRDYAAALTASADEGVSHGA